MIDANEIDVFGLKLNPKLYPKLYRLGLINIGRVKLILKVLKDSCGLKSYEETARKVEASQPVKVDGELVDVLEYPALYCWFSKRPKGFVSFFEEISERMWGGDKKEALKTMEGFFESKYPGE